MTPRELAALAREGAGAGTLSVYLDARVTDPAMRNAWRPALTTALRDARAAIADERERAAFDQAATFLEQPLPAPGGVWGARGWVAIATADGLRYAAELPVRVPTLAVWRSGPVVSPYVRVLKEHRPVIVALVDSRSARFFRYTWGTLAALPEATLTAPNDLAAATPGSSELRATSSPAPRGALDTERAGRRRAALFRRLAASIAARLAELAGVDGWILIGGTREWARLAAGTLAPRFADRLLVSSSLDHDATDRQIVEAAREAASGLRAMHGRALLERLLERMLPQGRGEVGVPATQRALRAQAVDVLLLSPEFLEAYPPVAEDAVHAALAQGAEVEVLSGEAAAHLDRAAGGIAARLRFAIDASPRHDTLN